MSKTNYKSKDAERAAKWNKENRERRNLILREWKRRNPEKVRASNAAYRKSPKGIETYKRHLESSTEVRRERALSKYGIGSKEYLEMLSTQGDCCGICGKHKDQFKKPLFVDHDHSSSQVRGLLCHNCNAGIGHFFDSEESLLSAIRYLKKSKGAL